MLWADEISTNQTIWAAIAGFVSAALPLVLSHVISRRKQETDIKETDRVNTVKEYQAIIEDLRKRVDRNSEEIEALRKEHVDCMIVNEHLSVELRLLKSLITRLGEENGLTISALKDSIHNLLIDQEIKRLPSGSAHE